MTITYIRWRDASHGMDEFDPSQMVLSDLQEVGWLVKEDDESVTLAMEHEDGSKARRLWLTIPRSGIVARRDVEFGAVFKEPKRRRKAE